MARRFAPGPLRALASLCGVACLWVTSGCATVAPPVVLSGAVDPSELARGAGSVSGQGGVAVVPGATPTPLAAFGGLHGDIGLGRRWAVRLDGEAIGLGGHALGGGRLGLRRTVPAGNASVGFGLSGGGSWEAEGRPVGWVGPDMEVAVGRRQGIVHLDVVVRGGIVAPVRPALHDVPWTLSWAGQLTLGLEPLEGYVLQFGLPVGVAVAPDSGATIAWVGGSVGLCARIGAPSPRARRDRPGRETPGDGRATR